MRSIPPFRRGSKRPDDGAPRADNIRRVALVVAAGAAIAVADPAIWLAETWSDSGYDSAGGHLSVVVALLAAWSLTSPLREAAPAPTFPWGSLGAVGVLRLAGHVLEVPQVGALAIPFAVYALGRLVRLASRRRPVSPTWLAVLVGLTLPIEHAVKRLFGYGLRHLSADGACQLLNLASSEVTCQGFDLVVDGHQLTVILSCSGARTLVLFSIVFAALAAVVRPSARQALAGLGLALPTALVVNSLRIALLAAGLAHEPTLGIDVMDQPWHIAVGLASLPVGLAPLAVWAWSVHQTPSADAPGPGRPGPEMHSALVATVALVAVGLAVPFAPRVPIHTAQVADSLELPRSLDDYPARSRSLAPVERRHFETHGAVAATADYGSHTLLVVETDAPLRHLHRPEQWLGDAGHTVETIGQTGGALPAAIRRIERPDGDPQYLAATFVSDRGRVATTVPEAIWYSAPRTTWRAYLRLHPVETPTDRIAEIDRQITRFFEVPRGPR